MTGPGEQPARSATAALRDLLGQFHADQRHSPGRAPRVVMTAELERTDLTDRLNELAALERTGDTSALEQTARLLGRAEAQRDGALTLLTEIVADLERGVPLGLSRITGELERIVGRAT